MALPKNKIIKIVVDAAKKYEDILNNSSACVKEFRANLISNLNKDELEKLIFLLEKVALSVEEK